MAEGNRSIQAPDYEDNVAIALTLTRVRPQKAESWVNTVFILMKNSEYETSERRLFLNGQYVTEFLRMRIKSYLKSRKGWQASGKCHNWGDFLLALPLPEYGILFDPAGAAVVAACGYMVNEDETLAPTGVPGTWTMKKDGKIIAERPALVSFLDGRLSVMNMPADTECDSCCVCLETGEVFPCDAVGGYQKLQVS